MTEKSLRESLEKLTRGNEEYAEMNAKIVATRQKVLGVHMADLRTFAKNLAREIREISDVKKLFGEIDDRIFEEVLLCGLMIFYAGNLTAGEKIALTKIYLAKVDSWAQIDTFVQDLAKEKFAKNAGETDEIIRAKYWNFALENLYSDQEFYARYGVMVLFENFLNAEKIAAVFANLRAMPTLQNRENSRRNFAEFSNDFAKNLAENSLKNVENYYAKMAVAWLYAESAIKFFDATLREMKNPEIDGWTRRKALTKMLESRRFSDAQKTRIRNLRAKISDKNLRETDNKIRARTKGEL